MPARQLCLFQIPNSGYRCLENNRKLACQNLERDRFVERAKKDSLKILHFQVTKLLLIAFYEGTSVTVGSLRHFLTRPNDPVCTAMIGRLETNPDLITWQLMIACYERRNSFAWKCLSCLRKNFFVQTNIFRLLTGTRRKLWHQLNFYVYSVELVMVFQSQLTLWQKSWKKRQVPYSVLAENTKYWIGKSLNLLDSLL